MHTLRFSLIRLAETSRSSQFSLLRATRSVRCSTSSQSDQIIPSNDLPSEKSLDLLDTTPIDESILPQHAFKDKKKKLESEAELLRRAVFPSFEPKSIMRRLERVKERIDPWATTLIYFPGEGNYYIGMGEKLSDYPNVLELFEVASRIMQVNLTDICFNGPIEKLAPISDEAIYVCSLAAAEKLRYERPSVIESCVGVIGSSVGEISALVFSGALSFEDGLRLIQIRNKSISEINTKVPSGLINVVTSADSQVKLGCRAAQEFVTRLGVPREEAYCSIAYYLFPHCRIIGGHERALEFLQANGRDFGFRRIKSITRYGSCGRGALHTPMMSPAEYVLKKAVVRMSLRVPKVPVYSGSDGKAYHSIESIVEKLPLHVSRPIKIEQIMRHLYYAPRSIHLPYSFELGPGKSMSDLLQRVNSRARAQMTSISA